MDENLGFLNFDGLDDVQVLHLKEMLHPSNFISEIEFPWDEDSEDKLLSKGGISSLNVHAPAFQLHVPIMNNHASVNTERHNAPSVSYTNGSRLQKTAPISKDAHFHPEPVNEPIRTLRPAFQNFPNGQQTLQQSACDQQITLSQHPKPFEGDFYPTVRENQQIPPSVSSFKLNPTVSCFIPQNMVIYPTQPQQPVNGLPAQRDSEAVNTKVNDKIHEDSVAVNSKVNHKIHEDTVALNAKVNHKIHEDSVALNANVDHKIHEESVALNDKVNHKTHEEREILPDQNTQTNLIEKVAQNGLKQNVEPTDLNVDALSVKEEVSSARATISKPEESVATSKPVGRSWADIVSKGQKPAKVTFAKPTVSSNEVVVRNVKIEQEKEVLLLAEDKMSFALGKHLHEVKLSFHPVLLQPRGLINRRNWCYINACLQALLACSPFYTLLRDLPLGPGVDRGKSSTPVIDSMVKVTYEFSRYDTSQEELQLGPPFQPDFMYEMLSDLKSDCLKGQQEDAEEFLSFILNGMHEEMVKIIKNYQKKTNIKMEELNGDISDEGDDWKVIQVGSKNKGMVTRKVVEHRTPISDLLGGQIKSFLTTKTVKTASIQPFFTLQLDIQSDNVTSVSEALKEMTVKVPIQGYVCAKSKQEVEAFNHVALQKLPPILILHLKRFVYNKNGGCKKVMKKTDYPLVLDISKDILSSDVKNENLRPYNLFAVMYHDGEEAVKGHYISDVYNHGSKTWIRCDDRSVTAVTEDQVLSYSPPRVPYLLFYQES